MNNLDIAFLCLTLFFLVRGFFRGLLREAASILGLFLGFAAANRFHDRVLPYVKSWLGDDRVAGFATYVLIFLGTMFALWVLVQVLRGVLKVTMLSWADNVFGAAFGLAKSVALCTVVIMALITWLPRASLLTESTLAPHYARMAVVLAGFLPEKIKKTFEDSITLLPRFFEQKEQAKEPEKPLIP